MLAHFIIYRLDTPGIIENVNEVLAILRATSLEIHSGPMGTLVQGQLEEVMAAICLCHRSLSMEHRILTTIVLEDDFGRADGDRPHLAEAHLAGCVSSN